MVGQNGAPSVPTGAAALAKGLDVLNLIGSSPRPLRFVEIQKTSGFPKPTLARILRTLLAYRLIKHNEENGFYSLGGRFIELAHSAWEAFDLRSAASTELERLSELTEETVAVCRLDGEDAIQYLDYRSSGGLSVQPVPNQRSPLHSTAAGKALVAFLPVNMQRSVIAAIDFDRYTEKTICDVEAYRAELGVTRARGYALSVEEFSEGVAAVATPISGPKGFPIGALTVMGPLSRFNTDKLHSTGRELMAAARRITGIAGSVALDSGPRPQSEQSKPDNVDCVLQCGTQLGEGPLWSLEEECLYWVDVFETTVSRFDPASGRHDVRNLHKLVSALVLTDKNNILAATQDGLEFLDFESGRLTPYVDPEPEKPNNRLNDAKCDSQGRLWVGSLRLDVSRADGGLYSVGKAGEVIQFESKVMVANGLDWSPDGGTFYFVDTIPGSIYAYDFDETNGTVSNRRLFASIPEKEGRPDGLTVDAEGNVWCAIWDGWRVDRFSPDGKKLEGLALPIPRPTSVIFGGPDLDTLYITSARVRLPAETLEKAPNSGNLFAYRPGVRGQKPNLFRE